MKVKFVKAAYGHQINETVELPEAEVKFFVAQGVAEEVKEVSKEESLVGEMADAIVADAAPKIEAKVAEAFKKEAAKLKGTKRPQISVGADLRESDPRGGFRNMGEFAKCIHAVHKGQFDERLNIISKGGMSESVSADGGYAVPTEFATQIMQIINSEESLLPMCKTIPTQTSTLDLPIDSLVNIGTNAISGAWISGDGTALTEKGSGSLGQLTFKLNKFGTLISATDELLNDNNVALEAFLVQKAGYDITYNVNDAIVRGGTGSTKPKGIINSAARVTVTANSADEYLTGLGITFTDIRQMVAHFIKTYNGSWSNVVWLVNPLVVADLYDLKDDAGRNLYYAPGTLSNSPYANLMGIRVLPSFHCSARGAEGDIILADMNAYVTVTKSTGVEAATSIHLYFDKDKTAFRFTYRIDGQPGLSAALVSPDGSGQKFSPFVTLSART